MILHPAVVVRAAGSQKRIAHLLAVEIQLIHTQADGVDAALRDGSRFKGFALIDAIYQGKAKIHEKLNHKFIEMDPKSHLYCRVSLGMVSFMVNRSQLMELYGKGDF